MRLLKGELIELIELIELLSRELSVPAATLSSLKGKPKDDRDERIKELEREVGQITMDNELLYAKIQKMDETSPA